ncbi:MAG: N-glycosylase/DNA lyase [Candidatus Aenigmarchaeota archaeon]|nr:N-glycosylase/DNA lyase [Candidatus Aenigmarchaeota archaeon]
MTKELLEIYKNKKWEIRKRLDEFKSVINLSDEKLFVELAFCILTPQSKATTSWNAIQALDRNNLLLSGTEKEILPFLQAIRFGETKSKRIVTNRKLFIENGKLKIKDKLSNMDAHELRGWLVENIDGYGMKEASHFIRNVGLSDNKLAILDRHILRNLKELGVIDDMPKSLTKKKYLEIEEKMKGFSRKIGVMMDELDLLLFFKETGMIFK